jgi:thiamine biosynthesis lipoprotein
MNRTPAVTARRRLAAAVVCLTAVTLSCRAETRGSIFRETRFAMGSVVEISVVAADERAADEHLAAAFAEIDRIDALLGSHGQQGEIRSLNERGHREGVRLGDETAALLGRARDVGRATGGAFDVTLGALMRVWDFDHGGRVPSAAELDEARGRSGWDRLFLGPDGSASFDRAGVSVDMGGIGQGYGADRAGRVLRSRGVAAGLVNISGDLLLWGAKPDGSPWQVGIQHPRQPEALLGTLRVDRDAAVVTSGDYERNFTAAGVTYAHILDPATGRPAAHFRSVTVVAPTAEEADVLATAISAMGPARAGDYLAAHPAVGVITVDSGGTLFVSPSLQDAFTPAG